MLLKMKIKLHTVKVLIPFIFPPNIQIQILQFIMTHNSSFLTCLNIKLPILLLYNNPAFSLIFPNVKPPLTNSLPLPYQHHPTTLFAPLSPQVSTSYHIGTPSHKRTTTRRECFEIDVNSCMSNAGKWKIFRREK